MKFDEKCPKCDSMKIGFIDRVIDRKGGTLAGNVAGVVGMAAKEGHFKGADVRPGDLWGRLEAYICTECGYYEQYVHRPEQVPFEMLEGFRWVHEDPQHRGPFR